MSISQFQAIFTPLGAEGFYIFGILFNMYTVVAYLMALICVLACFVIYFLFEESYVGIVTKEEKANDDIVVPMFDIPGSIICIYLFMIVNIIATNVEV